MDKWDHLDSGLSIIVLGIFGSIIEFYLTEKFEFASYLIIVGLLSIVTSIMNILPTPEMQAKLLERELSYDEAKRIARKNWKRRSNQFLIVLSVIGLAIIGYQLITDSDYKSYSGYGFSLEYPENIEVTVGEINNKRSTEENGIISFASDPEAFLLKWESGLGNLTLMEALNVYLENLREFNDGEFLNYMNYSVNVHLFVSVHFLAFDFDDPKYSIMGLGYCEESQRYLVIYYGTIDDDTYRPSFTHFLVTFECH